MSISVTKHLLQSWLKEKESRSLQMVKVIISIYPIDRYIIFLRPAIGEYAMRPIYGSK